MTLFWSRVVSTLFAYTLFGKRGIFTLFPLPGRHLSPLIFMLLIPDYLMVTCLLLCDLQVDNYQSDHYPETAAVWHFNNHRYQVSIQIINNFSNRCSLGRPIGRKYLMGWRTREPGLLMLG